MNLQDQVCSLELAERLKELGIKQESLFVWEYFDDKCYAVRFMPYAVIPSVLNEVQLFSAFTVAELGEMLPVFSSGYNQLVIEKSHMLGWFVKYECSRTFEHSTFNDNLADALAEMLIHLIENKLIEIN